MRKYLLPILVIIMCLTLSLSCFATEEEYDENPSEPFHLMGLVVLMLLLLLLLT